MPQWGSLIARMEAHALPEGTRLEFITSPDDDKRLTIIAHGKSSHGGVNLAGGRNALVALARATEGLLPASGEDDLLAFARMAGKDLYGTGLGLTENDPVWGRYLVNVATVKPKDGKLRLRTRDAAGAVASASRCVKANPYTPDGWYLLGLAREASGDAAGAQEAYRTQLQYVPGHEGARARLR